MRLRTVRWLTLAAIALLLTPILAACGSSSSSPTATPAATISGDLTVFAAASLTDAFNEAATNLKTTYPDLNITFNFAGSQALVTQLSDGARADVFASANHTQMTAAKDAGRVDGDGQDFVRNVLAIVVPKGNPGGVSTPADLAKDGVKVVLANPDVPVGGYSLEVLDKLSATDKEGAGFRGKVEANVVSHEANVRQVVTKVQLGEADAGIVYRSDITPDVLPDVEVIEIPEDVNVVARYPVALVEGGNAANGQAFIDYLLSADGQTLLEKWGFTKVGN